MKHIGRALIGAIIGFFGAYGILAFSDLSIASNAVIGFLMVASAVLVVLSLLRWKQIKNNFLQKVQGDEEDYVEELKYKRFADYSLFTNSGLVISLLTLSLSAIFSKGIYAIVLSAVLFIAHGILVSCMMHLTKYVYPQREFPSDSEMKNLLDYMDGGEKYIALQGLYKSFNLLNIALILAIIFATVYSVGENNSPQTFSIIAMCIILFLVNARYLLVVRNK